MSRSASQLGRQPEGAGRFHSLRIIALAIIVAAALLGASQTTAAAAPVQCHPVAVGDYVHTSSGDASGHGWWTRGTCSGVSTGYVTVRLQEYLSGAWHDKGTVADGWLPPGQGGPRVTARKTCTSTTTTKWRSLVTVNVSGTQYGTDQSYTAGRSIACRA